MSAHVMPIHEFRGRFLHLDAVVVQVLREAYVNNPDARDLILTALDRLEEAAVLTTFAARPHALA